MFWSFHPLADKTNNEHLPKPFFKIIRKSLYREKYMRERHKRGDSRASFAASLRLLARAPFALPLMDSLFAGWRNIWIPLCLKQAKSRIFEFTLKPYKRYIAIKEKQKDYVLVSFKVTLLLGVYAWNLNQLEYKKDNLKANKFTQLKLM